jgi:hypothetical protein
MTRLNQILILGSLVAMIISSVVGAYGIVFVYPTDLILIKLTEAIVALCGVMMIIFIGVDVGTYYWLQSKEDVL